ncbi:efflux RND transporter periplasmic adaptor subunit [Marinobacter sp. SS21]|uniref:efflux RND transporter periplasmic adaptor subunit n=1 Tax=Marinobacter sp. SS21 TaxID=2979460 RepID=UPI00232BCC1E|nr:efflux RND transporter periplasmic adaptor subunit [Marinobacter sp. SS21]MDC0662740.1 efflux RND transporter periplasmic adaptor subunit [Marinobacter sp. SS21]
MNKKLRLVLWGTLLVFMAGCGDQEPAPQPPVTQPVKVITIGSGNDLRQRDFPGTVRATQRVTMAFQVPGRLVELPVTEGQQVQAGDQLGLLDDSDYRSNLAAAQAELTRTEANFNRARELIERNYVSQADFDTIQANYNIAQSNLQKAQKALNDTRLVAPFDGVVARTFVQNFEEVQAKEPVLSLQNNRELEVVVNVPESLVVRGKDTTGLVLSGRFDGIPGVTFPLRVKEFATEASPDTQTFEYVLAIENTRGHNLLPGMTALVHAERSLPTVDTDAPLSIPLSALVAGPEDKASVWVVGEDDRVSQRPVVTGELVGNDRIEVRSGLAPGDTVVTAGVGELRDNMQVKPITKVEF